MKTSLHLCFFFWLAGGALGQVQAPKMVVNYAGKPVEPGNHANFVVAWNADGYNPTVVPAGSKEVTSISAGFVHALALKRNGVPVGWSEFSSPDKSWLQATVPQGTSDVAAIAAGAYHSVILSQDGGVTAWGQNSWGQLVYPASVTTGVVAIAAGGIHSVALKQDGKVIMWGGEAQFAPYGHVGVPLKAQSGVFAIAAGFHHTVALKQDGTVLAWGNNPYGETNVPAAAAKGVAAIAAGWYHTVALKQDGSIVAWGDNGYGQADAPGGYDDVVAIAVSISGSAAVKRDGSMVTWGGTARPPADLSGVVSATLSAVHTYTVVEPAGDFGNWGVTSFHMNSGAPPPGRDHAFSIANTGVVPLTLKASIEGPDADQFLLLGSSSASVDAGASRIINVRFSPTRVGSMSATLKLATNDPDTPLYTVGLTGAGFFASSYGTKPSVITLAGTPIYYPPSMDRATGLIWQKVTFNNPTGVVLNGLRLVISNLALGVTVQSSSATNTPGTAEVIYSKPIAVGETISLALTYHDPQRRTNLQPLIRAESLTEPEARDGPVNGVLVPLLCVRDTANGPLLGWNATPGKTYVVEYSDDNGKTWYSAVHRLVASSTRYLWTDRGQPETWSKPVNKAGRGYRVRRLE